MKAVVAMVAAAAAVWVVSTAIAGAPFSLAGLAGVAGPLSSAAGSWATMARTFRRDAERLTRMLTIGFAVKAVGFAVYMVLAIRWWELDRTPFIVSFVMAFIVLHAIEAAYLRQMLAGATTRVAVAAGTD